MYVSRLPFHVVPGKTNEVEKRLETLKRLILQAGGQRCRILRAHFGSDGQPDVILEQDAEDLAQLEEQIGKVTADAQFQEWSRGMSELLTHTPRREIFLVVAEER
jgi:hypothetical protein